MEAWSCGPSRRVGLASGAGDIDDVWGASLGLWLGMKCFWTWPGHEVRPGPEADGAGPCSGTVSRRVM